MWNSTTWKLSSSRCGPRAARRRRETEPTPDPSNPDQSQTCPKVPLEAARQPNHLRNIYPNNQMPASPIEKPPRRGLESFASRDFRRYQLARVAVILGAE